MSADEQKDGLNQANKASKPNYRTPGKLKISVFRINTKPANKTLLIQSLKRTTRTMEYNKKCNFTTDLQYNQVKISSKSQQPKSMHIITSQKHIKQNQVKVVKLYFLLLAME